MTKEKIKKEDHNKTVEATLQDIEKKFGKGTIMRLGDREVSDIPAISTTSLSLDTAIGIGGVPRGRIIEVYGPESSGKAQPLDCKVLTPIGWRKIGDLKIGDIVYSQDGSETSVIGIFPQGNRDVNRVTFSDKTSTRCCLEHLWAVQTEHEYYHDNQISVLSLKELLDNGLYTREGSSFKYRIPFNECIQFTKKALPMNPYLLGLLLGDGGFRDSSIKFSTADIELVNSIQSILERDFLNTEIGKVKNTKYDFVIRKTFKGHAKTQVRLLLESLNLADKKSEEKHIPEIYLFSDRYDRLELLKGLMDSDGTAHNNGESFSYSSSSPQLSKDFEFLCRSLGFRVSTSSKRSSYTGNGEIKLGLISYRSNIITDGVIPFKLTRKITVAGKHSNEKVCFNKFITEIESLGQSECVCIMVDHPDQLYITDDFIVTHNTTLALHIVAEAQKAGGLAAYIDSEHAMDSGYATALGVDIDNLLISQPDSGEQALEIAEALVRSNDIAVIVIDSVAALTPRAEIDGEMGDSLPGLQARLMSQACRKLTAIVASSNTCFIFINQLRDRIGVMYGSPEITSGGKALKFYASLRLDIRRIGAIKDGDQVVGNRTKVKVVKNKLAPPFKEAEFDITYGKGISRTGDVLDLAVTQNIVEKAGAWYSVFGERMGQGRENSKQYLLDNPAVLEKIESEVRLKLVNTKK